jgi:hypothetical protein
LIEVTQLRVTDSMHGDFASSNMDVRPILTALPPLRPEPSLSPSMTMVAQNRAVAFAEVLAANGVAGGIIRVRFRKLVSDFAVGVGG